MAFNLNQPPSADGRSLLGRGHQKAAIGFPYHDKIPSPEASDWRGMRSLGPAAPAQARLSTTFSSLSPASKTSYTLEARRLGDSTSSQPPAKRPRMSSPARDDESSSSTAYPFTDEAETKLHKMWDDLQDPDMIPIFEKFLAKLTRNGRMNLENITCPHGDLTARATFILHWPPVRPDDTPYGTILDSSSPSINRLKRIFPDIRDYLTLDMFAMRKDMYESGVRIAGDRLYERDPDKSNYLWFWKSIIEASLSDIIILFGNAVRKQFIDTFGSIQGESGKEYVVIAGRRREVIFMNHPEYLARWLDATHARTNYQALKRLINLDIDVDGEELNNLLRRSVQTSDDIIWDEDDSAVSKPIARKMHAEMWNNTVSVRARFESRVSAMWERQKAMYEKDPEWRKKKFASWYAKYPDREPTTAQDFWDRRRDRRSILWKALLLLKFPDGEHTTTQRIRTYEQTFALMTPEIRQLAADVGKPPLKLKDKQSVQAQIILAMKDSRLDHLFPQERKHMPMYTEDDDKLLGDMWREGHSKDAIAEVLGKKPSQIYSRWHSANNKYGWEADQERDYVLPGVVPKSKWTEEQDKQLASMMEQDCNNPSEISKALGKSKDACRKRYASKWNKIGLQTASDRGVEKKADREPAVPVGTVPQQWWTEEQDKLVASMRQQGYTWEDVSKAIGKSLGACRTRYNTTKRQQKAGIVRKSTTGLTYWTEEEDKQLFNLRKQGVMWRVIAEKTGRGLGACAKRHEKLMRENRNKLQGRSVGEAKEKSSWEDDSDSNSE